MFRLQTVLQLQKQQNSLYANIYLDLEIVNLLIYAYGTYHIGLMTVSKYFVIELQISKH